MLWHLVEVDESKWEIKKSETSITALESLMTTLKKRNKKNLRYTIVCNPTTRKDNLAKIIENKIKEFNQLNAA